MGVACVTLKFPLRKGGGVWGGYSVVKYEKGTNVVGQIIWSGCVKGGQ